MRIPQLLLLVMASQGRERRQSRPMFCRHALVEAYDTCCHGTSAASSSSSVFSSISAAAATEVWGEGRRETPNMACLCHGHRHRHSSESFLSFVCLPAFFASFSTADQIRRFIAYYAFTNSFPPCPCPCPCPCPQKFQCFFFGGPRIFFAKFRYNFDLYTIQCFL